MANVTLKVSPETMKQQAVKIQADVNSIRQQLQSIGDVVLHSTVYWEGEASDSHISSYNSEIKSRCEEILRRLYEQPDDLLRMAGIYETTEKEDTEHIMSLPQSIFG